MPSILSIPTEIKTSIVADKVMAKNKSRQTYCLNGLSFQIIT